VSDLVRAILANPWLKVASLALAMFTWLYVQGEEIEETRLITQIVWNLPRELLPTDAPPTNATLVVKGTRSAARKARAGTVRMVADVSRLPKGRHEVLLELDEIGERRLPIRAMPMGRVATGMNLDAITVDPALALVRGPRKLVDGLVELATRPLDVNGLAVTTVRPVELDLQSGLEVVSEGGFAARISLSSRLEQRTVVDVPVFVRGDPAYRPSPERISVAIEGPGPLLAGFDQSRLAAFVVVPSAGGRPQYEAWFGPREGVRVEVAQLGGDPVKVVSITPPSVVVATP
jgi:hypothetical protein